MKSLLFSALLAAAPACDTTAWQRAFAGLLSTYPQAALSDFYKLAHQGIRGSEHAVSKRADAAAWMTRELSQLAPLPDSIHEALVEPLPPHGRFVRVHLRPFVAAGGDPAKLVDAFVATANGASGDTTEFSCAERVATALMEKRGASDSVRAFFAARRKAGFEAVHHSTGYSAAYRPAYRVILASFVARVMPGK